MTKTNENVGGLVGLYVVARSEAGVHTGILESCDDKGTVVLLDSMCLHSIRGYAGLDFLVVEGVTKPEECRFTIDCPRKVLFGVWQLMPISSKAEKILRGVKRWRL